MSSKLSFVLQQSAVAFLAFAFVTPAMADETIGIWTVNAPDSASLISGTLDPNNWLNVVDAPVTVNDAFSGESILDDGFANSEEGLTFEVVFNGGVVNSAGDDLVLFEAQFDAGSYFVTSDFDGHTASLALSAFDFINTGESRDYFFGNNPSGPFTADIWGIAFDLSDLGLSDGDSATRIRFTSTDSLTDPIGIGAIVPEPVVGGPLLVVFAVVACRTRQRRKQR